MLVVVNKQESTKELQEMTELSLEYVSFFAKPQIISWLVPIMLSGQTYFRSDTTRLWPDKYTLRHTSIKGPPPPPPPLNPTPPKLLLYMNLSYTQFVNSSSLSCGLRAASLFP